MGISMTIIIVIMTSLISWQAFNNPMMRAKLLFRPVDIKQRGEWYRFVSSGLIHADFAHLLINMYVLWMFGEIVEQYFTQVIFGEIWGRIAYLLFYFSAVVVASIPSYLRYRDFSGYSALGASGATSALVFAYIIIQPWSGLTLIFLPFFSIPAIVMGVAYLWYSHYMDKRGTDHIGHNAHFTGAIYGVIFVLVAAAIFEPRLLEVIWANLLAGPV
ncbi:MAG: rhomboid family intramembrane serine protease [Bacteroidetes bacterium]|nr:MAG: rhomboid family intramembrane serine protease [Bacteroidota bacterium]